MGDKGNTEWWMESFECLQSPVYDNNVIKSWVLASSLVGCLEGPELLYFQGIQVSPQKIISIAQGILIKKTGYAIIIDLHSLDHDLRNQCIEINDIIMIFFSSFFFSNTAFFQAEL